ncbi:MAG TPA: ABC transporter permease [Mycobacteriales bacterium]|nr:ABC transporter permease [Mycobacteriales bacterium]
MLPFVIGGLVTGSLYGLSGLGLVLTYRTSGVFNFAHGAIAAAAAFLFYALHDQHNVPWPIAALLVVVVFSVGVGSVMEWLTRTLSDAPAAVVVVVTVGLFLLLDGALSVNVHDVVRDLPPFLPQSGFTVADYLVSWEDVIIAVTALVGAVSLYAFLRTARLGVAMRAVVDNATLVRLTGEPPATIRRTAWSIGCGFAAISGILLARSQGLDVTQLTFLVVQAFGACAIGRFASLPMTYVGGLVVGVIAALTQDWFTTPPFSQLADAVPFLVLIAVLLVVPLRLLPRGNLAFRGLVSNAAQLSRRSGGAITAVLGLALVFVPHAVGSRLPEWISAESSFVIFASLALLIWTSGQISLCQMSFAALGATTMAHVAGHGVPWPLALLIAGLLTVPVGALVAIPAIRLSGVYLALVTLGFGIVMEFVIYPTFLMFGSGTTALSVNRPAAGPFTGSDESTYYLALIVVAIVCVALVAIQRSRFGRLLRAMSESPMMLATLGLNVNVTRLMVFCLSAFFAGIGGALVITQFPVGTTAFMPIQSLILVAVLAICAIVGTRPLLTSALAALLIEVLPGYVTSFSTDYQTLFFGIAAVLSGLVLANRDRLSAALRAQGIAKGDRLAHSPVAHRTATAAADSFVSVVSR